MEAYIYKADLLCGECGVAASEGLKPSDDSDSYPQGPYADGGGEADTAQHCGACHVFLENPLTSDGINGVREAITRALAGEDVQSIALTEWAPFYKPGPTDDYLAEVTAGYIECALWSESHSAEEGAKDPSDGHSFDYLNFGPEDLTEEARKEAATDVASFVQGALADLVGMAPRQIGHDFMLTRNRHGAGFWDRGLGEQGERLTKAANAYGTAGLYLETIERDGEDHEITGGTLGWHG